MTTGNIPERIKYEYTPYEEYLGFADFEGEDLHPRASVDSLDDDEEELFQLYCSEDEDLSYEIDEIDNTEY